MSAGHSGCSKKPRCTQLRKLFLRKLFAALKVTAETIFRFKQGILTTFRAYDKSMEVKP